MPFTTPAAGADLIALRDEVERAAGRVRDDEVDDLRLRERAQRQCERSRAGRAERGDRGAPPHGFLSRMALTQPSPRDVVTFV